MGQRCYLGAVRGSKRTKASDRREHHQLMSPCFPRSLPPSPQVSRFSLESLPPNFLSLSSPTFPWPHRSLCLTLCVPGFSVCLSTSLPCSCLQGSVPKRLISHAHPWDPLTWILPTREALVGGSRPEEMVCGMSPPARALSFLLQLPPTAPPSFAGFGYPLPHLGFRLLAATLPRPLPPFPGSL